MKRTGKHLLKCIKHGSRWYIYWEWLPYLLRYLCIGTQHNVSPFGLLQVQLTRYKTQSRLRIAMLLCRVLTSYCPLSLHYTLPGGDIDQLLIVGRSCHPLSMFKGRATSAISMASISLRSTWSQVLLIIFAVKGTDEVDVSLCSMPQCAPQGFWASLLRAALQCSISLSRTGLLVSPI